MKMGIDKYNAECRKIVMRYSSEWEVSGSQQQIKSLTIITITFAKIPQSIMYSIFL